MARLRIRIELSRGGVGVPLHKIASVVGEAEKFLHLLGEDVHIDKNRGEWLGFEFDSESLNFTAEYVGPVTTQQVDGFYAAFDGTTPLRRDTIAQFARIADAIGEDEVIGFGLYQAEEVTEPTEWRCLSRRDALRIADEIQTLLAATEPAPQESHLPAIKDPALGARIFGDRRMEHRTWSDQVRAVESNLSRRIARVENQVEQHTGMIQDLRLRSTTTEESFRSLLSSVESFCEQAARKIESVTLPPALPAPGPAALPAPATALPTPPTAASTAAPPKPTAPEKVIQVGASEPARRQFQATAIAAVILLTFTFVFLGLWLWPSRTATAAKETAVEKPAAAVEKPAGAAKPVEPPARESAPAKPPAPVQTAVVKPVPPNPAPAKAPAPEPIAVVKSVPPNPAPTLAATVPRTMHVELSATEPTWIYFVEEGGNRLMSQVLMPGSQREFDLAKGATLRTGNAAGLAVSVDGKSLGALGGEGKVREIHFRGGTYSVTDPTAAPEAEKR